MRNCENGTIDTVFFDMDGVLADFDERCVDILGESLDSWAVKNRKEDGSDPVVDFLKKEVKNDFFEHLLPMRDFAKMHSLMYTMERNGYDVAILTAVGKSYGIKEVIDQKREWLRTYGLSHFPFYYTIIGKDKGQFAAPNRLLIDDTVKCYESFMKAGGSCILHSSYCDTYEELVKKYGW